MRIEDGCEASVEPAASRTGTDVEEKVGAGRAGTGNDCDRGGDGGDVDGDIDTEGGSAVSDAGGSATLNAPVECERARLT